MTRAGDIRINDSDAIFFEYIVPIDLCQTTIDETKTKNCIYVMAFAALLLGIKSMLELKI